MMILQSLVRMISTESWVIGTSSAKLQEVQLDNHASALYPSE